MNLFKKLDTFQLGARVSLTTRGKTTYESVCGGLLSVLVVVLLIIYFIILLTHSQSNETTMVTSSSGTSSGTSIGDVYFTQSIDYRVNNKHEAITDQNRAHNLTEAGYFYSLTLSITYDPTKIEVYFQRMQRDLTFTFADTRIPAVECDSSNFNTDLFDEFFGSYLVYSNMLCPDYSENAAILQNDPISFQDYIGFEAVIKPCSGDSCASEEEIENYLQYNQMAIFQIGHYYDHDDPTNPVKQYVEVYQPIYMDGSQTQFITIPITETVINFVDGSSFNFYDGGVPQVYSGWNHIAADYAVYIQLQLTGEIFEINQEYNYQPIMDRRMLEGDMSDKRDLSDSQSADSDDGFLYTAFFVLAQIGGFYSFLKLTIGSIISYIY